MLSSLFVCVGREGLKSEFERLRSCNNLLYFVSPCCLRQKEETFKKMRMCVSDCALGLCFLTEGKVNSLLEICFAFSVSVSSKDSKKTEW